VNIWGRSGWYRLYIIVGLPVMIALTVLATLRADPLEPSILPILAPVLVWVAGLLVLQWIFLLRRGAGPVTPEGEEPPAGAADPPLDREALRATLVLRAGGKRISAVPTPQAFAVRGFAFITALTIALPAGAILYMTGAVDTTVSPLGAGGPAIPVAVLPGLALVVVEVGDAWLGDLGLSVASLPAPTAVADSEGAATHITGSTVYAGERHGRPVWIEQTVPASSVQVAQPVPTFAARERQLALVPEPGAPPPVAAALLELSPHPRWANIRVTGGADGVLVEREGGSSAAFQALWLDDLWLAERLAAAADSRPDSGVSS
jgi:hypothetical protein